VGADGVANSLVDWMERRGFLRGPFVYGDYWGSVLGLPHAFSRRQREEGLVDPVLFRVGLDRPDLEVPRLRHYLVLFLLGPFLLLLRRFQRLGRHYRLSYRSEVGREVEGRLTDFRLDLAPAGRTGRVHVEKDGRRLAEDVLDPRLVAGFASFFHATYKLPLASLTAILSVAILAPVLHAGGWLGPVLEYWIPVGFPALVALVYLVYRDLVTAVLAALPVVVARFLVPVLGPPGGGGGWSEFLAALTGLFLLYLVVDWLFMPRPVPPVLMMYSRDGPARTYDREGDAPWWLAGDVYWVWRYLVLTPAELNKFWERDWERVELWIRADGRAAGELEWVVTDAHYRELWLPAENLATEERRAADVREARESAGAARPGFWLVETDADLVFHTPFVRALSFLPDREDRALQGAGHLLSALWKRPDRHDPSDYREALERIQLREGVNVFGDVPEATSRMVSRHLLAMPWRYWRYPLGAATARPARLYGDGAPDAPPPAADPGLQVKEDGEGGD
jgi:hypothetical protein